MNILHISRTMGQGGAEKVVFQICKESKENMVIASTGVYYEKELANIGVKHYKIPDIDKKNPFIMLRTLIILEKIVKKEKIDIIHSHHRMAAFYSRLLSLLSGNKIKRIYTAHNVFFNKKYLLRFALKGSKVIAVGNGVKENLVQFYNIDERRIDIIYNSVEMPKEINAANDEIFEKKGIFIGCIGRLSKQKGIDIFIKAMDKVLKNNKNIYGVIIGDGELKDEMCNLCKELGISDNIIFLGYRKDVLNLIKKLDFVVLSSRWEGFPLTPIEAFMMGKTVIASNIDGNNEIVKDKINGLLFEKDNYCDLARKIDFLINNRAVLNDFNKKAFLDYEQKFSYKNFIEKYSDLYEELKND